MTSSDNAADAAALSSALETVRALRVRLVTAVPTWDVKELERTLAQALAGCDRLVLAMPAPTLDGRHSSWLIAFSRAAAGQTTATLARAAVNHLEKLALASRRPVLVPDPGARFAGEFDDVVVGR